VVHIEQCTQLILTFEIMKTTDKPSDIETKHFWFHFTIIKEKKKKKKPNSLEQRKHQNKDRRRGTT
jgi:hypothetical protein